MTSSCTHFVTVLAVFYIAAIIVLIVEEINENGKILVGYYYQNEAILRNAVRNRAFSGTQWFL